MRESIKKLTPQVHTSKSGRRYSRLNLGAVERVEDGGYKLEGDVFATGGREAIHDVIEQFMDRVDEAIEAPPFVRVWICEGVAAVTGLRRWKCRLKDLTASLSHKLKCHLIGFVGI
jgi:hypothetical protein